MDGIGIFELQRDRGIIPNPEESAGFSQREKPRGKPWKILGLFTVIRPYTVRFSEIENPTVRFGAVFRNQESYGALPCGYQI